MGAVSPEKRFFKSGRGASESCTNSAQTLSHQGSYIIRRPTPNRPSWPPGWPQDGSSNGPEPPKRVPKVWAWLETPFPTIHDYSPLLTTIGNYSSLFTIVHQCSPLPTAAHRYSQNSRLFTYLPIFTQARITRKTHVYDPCA